MKRFRLIYVTLGVFAVILTAFGVAMSQTRATVLPVPQQVAAYTPPAIQPVAVDPERQAQYPTSPDSTKLGTLPFGVGAGNIPKGTPRPLKTNKWWSGGMLETWPSPAFPLPFKAIFNDTGLVLSVPRRRVQDKTIFADDKEPIRVFAARNPTGAMAINAGDWDVTFRVRDGVSTQYDATIIQGSPYVFIRPQVGTLSVAVPAGAQAQSYDCKGACGSAVMMRGPTTTFLVVSPVKGTFVINGGVVTATFSGTSKLMTVVAVPPDGNPVDYLAGAVRPYTGTTASYSISSSQVTTTYRFPEQTVMGIFPHQTTTLAYNAAGAQPSSPLIDGNISKLIGTFETVRGPVRMYAGKGFRTVLPRPSILPSLPPLKSLQADKNLKAQLQKEIDENKMPAGDIYFAAKDMFRIATLAELADAMGDMSLRAKAVQNAETRLAQFCTADAGDPFMFTFDATAGGLIALPVGFGSEKYNDHHFHYGYFLHAAAILGRYDPSFLKQYDTCFRLMTRDIATSLRNDASFPYLRYFDPYGGHSWAGGVTNFADGNNQESVSEAMHAWYALALFGRTTGQRNMEALGTWMFAQESNAARVYWLNAVPQSGAIPADFPFPMISLLWGGKADYATWFDGSDAAIRGIQFFPTTVALLPILEHDTIKRIAAPAAAAAEKTIWKSGLTLVQAPFDPGAYVPADWPIDPVNSRTFADYWTRAFHELGAPVAATGSCAGEVFQNGTTQMAAIYRFPTEAATCAFTMGSRTVNLTQLTPGWNLRKL
jgi:endoglucanase Acf2